MRSSDERSTDPLHTASTPSPPEPVALPADALTEGRFDMATLPPPPPTWRYLLGRIDLRVQLGRLALILVLWWLWWSGALFNGVPIKIFGFEPLPEIEDLFVAGPGGVWDFLTSIWSDSVFWSDLRVTLTEAVAGFLLGSTFGFVAGLILGRSERLAKVFSPLLVFANATPKIALAPILILWYGIDIGSKIALATIIVFFIVQIPTQAAIKSIDPDLHMLATAMGSTEMQRFRKVVIPGILGPVFGGLRLAAVISMLSVVFGEFVASRRGLGQRLLTSSNQFNMEAAFGLMIVLALLALALNGVIGLIERRLLRWQSEETHRGQIVSPL